MDNLEYRELSEAEKAENKQILDEFFAEKKRQGKMEVVSNELDKKKGVKQ